MKLPPAVEEAGPVAYRRLKAPVAASLMGVKAPRTPRADTDAPLKVKVAGPSGKPWERDQAPLPPRV